MYFLASPKTREKVLDKNIFNDPLTVLIKNSTLKSNRDIIGIRSSFAKLSEQQSQSFEQSQHHPIELTKFQKFCSSIKPSIAFMKQKQQSEQQRQLPETKPKKKIIVQPELFTKNEVIQQLKQIKQKNRINLDLKNEIVRNLKFQTKLQLTRDQRILTQFQQLQQDRADLGMQLGCKTGRSVDQTLYQKSNQYRRKVELIKELDNNQLMDQRQWYRDIRKKRTSYNIENSINDSSIADVFANFSTHHTPKQNYTEIISLNDTTQLFNKSNRIDKYTQNLKSRLRQLSPDCALLSFNFQQDLQLKGTNKFNDEFQCVLQDNENQMYQIIQNDNKKNINDEVFIDNWNQKEVQYPKLSKYIM